MKIVRVARKKSLKGGIKPWLDGNKSPIFTLKKKRNTLTFSTYSNKHCTDNKSVITNSSSMLMKKQNYIVRNKNSRDHPNPSINFLLTVCNF